MKKTKKYYREEIAKNYAAASRVLVEAVKKYGKKCKTRGWRVCPIDSVSNEWNARITGFSYSKKKLWIDYYWQGDDTDGDDSVEFDSKGIYVPAEHYNDGERTREEHSDIRFSVDELYEAIKNFSKEYLTKTK